MRGSGVLGAGTPGRELRLRCRRGRSRSSDKSLVSWERFWGIEFGGLRVGTPDPLSSYTELGLRVRVVELHGRRYDASIYLSRVCNKTKSIASAADIRRQYQLVFDVVAAGSVQQHACLGQVVHSLVFGDAWYSSLVERPNRLSALGVYRILYGSSRDRLLGVRGLCWPFRGLRGR